MFKSPQSAFYSLSIANYGQVDIGALQEAGNVSSVAEYTGPINGKVGSKSNLTLTVTGGSTLKVGHSLVIAGTNVAATATITMASAIAGDTVRVNGLVYTGVAGAKADDTQFSIDTGDNAAATDLADSIDGDTRLGVLENVSAASVNEVVTVTHIPTGPSGNDNTISSSNGTRMAVTAFAGGVGVDGLHPIVKVIDATHYVIDVDFTADVSGTWTSLGAKGPFAGFMPMTAITAGQITSMTFHDETAHAGNPAALAYIAGVFYPFPGLIDEIIISAGDLRMVRYSTKSPQ